MQNPETKEEEELNTNLLLQTVRVISDKLALH